MLNLRGSFRIFFLILSISLMPVIASAHPSPNSMIFLDFSPGQVRMEIQMPLTELELAFGHNLSANPEKALEEFRIQLTDYLGQHVHAYSATRSQWIVNIAALQLEKGIYSESNLTYWELVANLVLVPGKTDNPRHFFISYDAIMHQVMNHAAFVSVRSDWEKGELENKPTDLWAISWDLKNNRVPPLEVNLEKGSIWTGVKSMIMLGAHHISEGADHLMFLLVLLLPAPLIARSGRWNGHANTKSSVLNLLKIITAFTIGHSLTLVLGTLGWVRLPAQYVEILIAISILISAIHALKPIFPGREKFVAGGFGLIHGLAFAATLSNLHLSKSAMVLSLLGFNIGIELMQLFIVMITVPWLLIISRNKIYEWVRISGAVFASFASLGWVSQRVLGSGNLLTAATDSIIGYSQWLLVLLALLAVGIYLRSRLSFTFGPQA